MELVDETMDGKNTFHSTQIAAWQRGYDNVSLLGGVGPLKKRILDVPESMDRADPINIRTNIPVFIKAVKTTWFNSAEEDVHVNWKYFLKNAALTAIHAHKSLWNGFEH